MKRVDEYNLEWLKKYAFTVFYLASEYKDNPYRPGEKFLAIYPDGTGNYTTVYCSDYYHALESGMIPLEEMKTAIGDFLIPHYAENYLGLRKEGWQHSRIAGPLSKEGWTEENPQFLIKNVYLYFQNSGDLELFKKNKEILETYIKVHPSFFQKENGLIYFEKKDVFDPVFRKRGYGFYDTVLLSGYVLFPTLLYWEAYHAIASLFQACGEPEKRNYFLSLADKIQKNIKSVFWDEEKGLLLAATETCRQGDVWGSAYAVCIGIVDEETSIKISQTLARYYPSITWRGQVHHMVEPEGWEKVDVSCPEYSPKRVNRYQNGAFWGHATGWLFTALLKTDRELAERLLLEVIEEYKSRGAYECVHPDGNYTKCLHYTTNLGILINALVKSGYIEKEELERYKEVSLYKRK